MLYVSGPATVFSVLMTYEGEGWIEAVGCVFYYSKMEMELHFSLS